VFTIGWKYFSHAFAEEFSKVSVGCSSTELAYLAKLQNGLFPRTMRRFNKPVKPLTTQVRRRSQRRGTQTGAKAECASANTYAELLSKWGKNYVEI